MTTLVDEKTEKPEFKMTHGKDYVEKQVIYLYICNNVHQFKCTM